MNFSLQISAVSFLAASILAAAATPADEDSLAAWRRGETEVRSSVLALARRAFDRYVTDREVIDPPAGLPPVFARKAAVFVSTMRNGAPRCCMGTLYPAEPSAAREIIASAVAAAGRDRRFRPIKPDELSGLTLIVSIVGRPRPISQSELGSLDPVRDGLVAKRGDRFGVVLSGETPHLDRMVQWARIRSGAGPNVSVQYFKISDVRFVESKNQ